MSRTKLFALSLIFSSLVAAWPASARTRSGSMGKQPNVDFVKEVQPLLKASCFQCHGSEKQAGGLRLDLKSGALTGGASGKAILPGGSKQSLLIKRVLGSGGLPVMPMGFAPLTKTQVDLLRNWIDQAVGNSEW